MTPKQIKKALIAGGISEDVIESSITIIRDEVEIYVEDHAVYDFDATGKLTDEVSKILGWGGFKCGYGGWVLRAGYTASDADYCDKSSPIHY